MHKICIGMRRFIAGLDLGMIKFNIKVLPNDTVDLLIKEKNNIGTPMFNKYQIIKGAVSYVLANFIFNYFLLNLDAVKWMYDNNITYDTGMLGTWTDAQIPNTYSHYADPVMETLLS